MMPPDYFPTTVAQYMAFELTARKKRSPHYSMRAFARDLNLSPSTVSDLMKHKLGLSPARAKEVAKKLKLGDTHAEHFVILMEASFSRSAEKKKKSLHAANELAQRASSQMKLDEFAIIAEWYHLAILEFLSLSSYYHQAKTLSKVLGISTLKVNKALKRLTCVGLIDLTEKPWKVLSPQTNVQSLDSVAAIQHFLRQIQKKSIQSLSRVGPEKRMGHATLFSMPRKDFPEFKKEFQKLLKQLIHKYHFKENKDTVYVLASQVFALEDLLK